jgi:Family of unknown function (DUF6527)
VKSQIRSIDDHGLHYEALAFVCPGCQSGDDSTGLHMLPVNSTAKSPAWTWDGNLEAPTLSPSILTHVGPESVCHSFLTAGVFSFLGDCTHPLAGQQVAMVDLPDWFVRETTPNNP